MRKYKVLKNTIIITFVLFFNLFIVGCTATYSDFIYISEKQSENNSDIQPFDIVSINKNVDYNLEYYLGSGLTLVSIGSNDTEKRFGCIDSKGNIVIPIEYISINKFYNNVSLVMDSFNKYKYINNIGTVICEDINGVQISSGSDFNNGFANLNLNYRTGSYVIDETGVLVLEPTSKGYSYSIVGNSLFNVYQNSIYVHTIDSNGTIIHGLQNPIYANKNFTLGFYYDQDLDKYGFMNTKTFKKLSEPIIEKFTFFEYDTTLCTIDGELLLINSSLDVLENLSLIYEGIDAYNYTGFSESVATLTFLNSTRTIVIDNLGTLIADTDFDIIYDFSDGFAVYEKDNKYGYMSISGEVLITPLYDIVTQISNNTGFLQYQNKIFKITKVV